MPISVASPRRIRGLAAPLRAVVRAALALEGRRPGEIAILLTDDATIRALNRRWRKLDRATDVLSFVYDEEASSRTRPGKAPIGKGSVVWGGASGTGTRGRRREAGLFAAKRRKEPAAASSRRGGRSSSRALINGDLAISIDRMEAQTRRFRVSRGEELARLVVHGTLHLAGLDHHREPERRHMRARERQALRAARPQVRALDRALARG
ncbi:MAG: rRNA maturation RNase YbeY [Candidatus Eisenbacteria bacterium]|nr:rRNA maturation RNase YbeY [Candidatus Eisenbacteria bacterium]